jgi:hypothetical protein
VALQRSAQVMKAKELRFGRAGRSFELLLIYTKQYTIEVKGLSSRIETWIDAFAKRGRNTRREEIRNETRLAKTNPSFRRKT